MNLTRTRSQPVPLLVLALVAAAGAVLLDTVFHVSLRLPGHRAFPGALAVLLLAGTLAPVVLVAAAGAVAGALVALDGPSLLPLAWLLTAGLLAAVRPERLAWALIAGLLFGALRYLGLPAAFHHAPDAVRLGGHLTFGLLGGIAGHAAIRALGRLDKERSP